MAQYQSIPIKSIHMKTSKTEQISVRVMRLWWKRSETDPTEVKGVELILLDENGDTIQATIKKQLVKIFAEKLNEGDTYKIRKFSTTSNRLGYDMATNHQCKIWLEYSTRVVPVQIANIPLTMHAFYTFNDIFAGLFPDRLYVDVIGRLEHIYPIKVNNEGKKRRTIILGNNQNQQLCCTLFGDYIDQMSAIEEQYKGQAKPTLVLYFIKRSVYEGEVSISTTWGATQILVNPNMNEVHEFKESFADVEADQNLLGAQNNGTHHPPILASANVKTLAEINSLTKSGSYVTMATFVELDTTGGWYYNSCKECRRKVQLKEDGLYYCDKESDNKKTCSLKGIGSQSAIPRFQVKFFVTYENANSSEFIIWDDAMAELLGKTAKQILEEDEIYNVVPPPDFMPLIDRDFIVKVKVTQMFNIEHKSSSYGVISLCDDPRTIAKWKAMHEGAKEQAISILSSSSKDTTRTDSMMEIMREMTENEPVAESEEVTPQKRGAVVADTSDKSSATKLQEIKMGKSPMCL